MRRLIIPLLFLTLIACDSGSAAEDDTAPGAPSGSLPDAPSPADDEPGDEQKPAPELPTPPASAGPDGTDSTDGEDDRPAQPEGVPLPVVDDFAAAGPFAVESEVGGPDGAFTLFVPQPLGQDGVLHPILTWGNGTGATPSAYRALLRHLASHGFVVIASNSTQTGSGAEMLRGVDFLLAEHEREGSPFFSRLDAAAIGALGHSQGGGGAINAGNDPRVSVTCPIEPAPGTLSGLHGPMLVLGGGADTVVSVDRLVRPLVFARSRVPTILAVLKSASHFEPVGAGGEMRAPITAWFRFQLGGDDGARTLFEGDDCALCVDERWLVEKRNF